MPVRLSVDASALEGAALRLDASGEGLTLVAAALARTLAERAARELAAATPRSPGEPQNAQGQHAADLWRVTAEGPAAYGVVNDARTAAGVAYVPFLFSGTSPHDIDPVAGQMLHWVHEGVDVFAHTVHHPGTRASAPLVDALAGQEAHADAALAALGGTLVRRLAAAVRGGE